MKHKPVVLAAVLYTAAWQIGNCVLDEKAK